MKKWVIIQVGLALPVGVGTGTAFALTDSSDDHPEINLGGRIDEPHGGQARIRSDKGIDPDGCNLIHNINACDEDELRGLGGPALASKKWLLQRSESRQRGPAWRPPTAPARAGLRRRPRHHLAFPEPTAAWQLNTVGRESRSQVRWRGACGDVRADREGHQSWDGVEECSIGHWVLDSRLAGSSGGNDAPNGSDAHCDLRSSAK